VVASGPGGTLANASATTTGSGAASFSGLTLSGTVGSYTLRFESSNLTSATSSAIALSAGAAATMTINGGDGQSATVGTAVATPPSVIVRDGAGNSVADVTVSFTVTAGGGTVSPTSGATNGSGIAAVTSWTLGTTPGTNTLTATASGLTGSPVTFTATATAGAAAQLAITTEPSSSASSGIALAQQPVLQLQDANGNPVSQSGVTVTAVVASGPGGTLANASATTTGSGAASFSGLTLSGTVGSYTLRFESTNLGPAISSAIALGAGAAATIGFTAQPSSAAAGATISPAVQVTARDAQGNTATAFAGTVTLGIGINPAGGTLSGTTSAAPVNGVATFSNLSIDKPGTGYTLTADATGLAQATSDAFNITPPPATHVVFTVQPSSTTAGEAIAPAVEVTVLDAQGNTATGFSGNITVAIGTNAGGGTLSGTTSAGAANGVATFSNLRIDKAGSGYTLAASASGLTGATSNSFDITPGAATQLSFTVQPTNTAAFGTISPPVQVTASDAFGNVATTFTGQVAIAIGHNGGLLFPGTLSGSLSVAAVAGVATFADLSIDQPGSNYTLVVSAGTLAGAESAFFDITVTP